MSMLKSLALTSLAHGAKIISAFALMKLIAIYMGPQGIGQLGHMMSVVSILTVLSGGGIINGVVKYTSEYRGKPIALFRFVNAAALYASVFALVVMVIGIIFSGYIAELVFNERRLYPIICVLAIAQVLFAFSNVVFGVSNGLSDTKVFSYSQLFGCLVSLPLSWFVISYYGFIGAALSLFLASTLCALPAFFYFKRSIFWNCINFSLSATSHYRKLLSYTIMLVFSTVCFPVVEIYVRQTLIDSSGYHDAGIWQASIRMSAAYLGFFTVFLGFYYMPKLSSQFDGKVMRSIVFKFLAFVQVVFIVGALLLYLFRSSLIPIMFSSEFSLLNDLVQYQLIGDFFKISSYVFGFIAVAKAATRLYIAAEVFQGSIFIGLVLVFKYFSIGGNGVEGVMQAYMFTYIVYFVISLSVTVVYLRNNINNVSIFDRSNEQASKQ